MLKSLEISPLGKDTRLGVTEPASTRSSTRHGRNGGGADIESPSGEKKPAFNGFQGPAYPPCLPPDLFD